MSYIRRWAKENRVLDRIWVRRLYSSFHFKKKHILSYYYRRKNSGAGSKVDPDALILGWRNIQIGKGVMISEGVVLNVNNRDEKTRIKIGDFTAINRDCFFVSGEMIEIGPYGLFGPGCRVLGGNHNTNSPMIPYIASGNSDTGKIVIGTNCWLGAGVTILGSITVGHGCVIGANSFVLIDIPPFSVVVGSPARVIKRFDLKMERWVSADMFTAQQEMEIPSEATYLDIMQRDYPWIDMPFAASGRSRGDLA